MIMKDLSIFGIKLYKDKIEKQLLKIVFNLQNKLF